MTHPITTRVRAAATAMMLALWLFCGCTPPAAQQAAESQAADAAADEPLRGGAAPAPVKPPDAILIDLVSDAVLLAPFTTGPVGGRPALTLPAGSASADSSGRATFDLAVPQEGTYHLWAYVFWEDGCGNSLALAVDDGAERVIGQDGLYGEWHWVAAGPLQLTAAPHRAMLGEREDGVGICRLLLTEDPAYRPVGSLDAEGSEVDVRRFADDFSRSPGHGLVGWEVRSGDWQIAFSYDPNRIANQYTLLGRAATGPAAIAIADQAWSGCRLRFAFFPEEAGRYAATIDGGDAALQLEVPSAAMGLRLQQWHQIEIERWAWYLGLRVDGKLVREDFSRNIGGGELQFVVASGSAYFDDVEVAEMPWQLDDGQRREVPWQLGPGADWRRHAGGIIGRSGWVEAAPTTNRLLLQGAADRRLEGARLAAGAETAYSRIAAGQLPDWLPRQARLGPYHFNSPVLEDPSDYLDFTPEEYAAMATDPEADKLRREGRKFAVVGGQDNAAWVIEAGSWQHDGQALHGLGPDARARHYRQLEADFTLRFKLKMTRASADLGIGVYGDATDYGTVVGVAGDQLTGDWQQLTLQAAGDQLTVQVADRPVTTVPRGPIHGGVLRLLLAAGGVAVDDLEILVDRVGPAHHYYAFDRRETDWWRSGDGWTDHGGIACVLASSWVTLKAPESEAMLWHKGTFSGDLLLAFDIEETSEWYGWEAHPSHVHFPVDNIDVCLSVSPESDDGYRLVLNTRERTATELYRNGALVAEVVHGPDFPLRYVGGHAPYSPRRSRLLLTWRGNQVRFDLNGVVVLSYEDPQPLPVHHLGIGGHHTHANFSNLVIRELR